MTPSPPHSDVQGEGGFERAQERDTLAELVQQVYVHANQITQCLSQLLEGAADLFVEARAEVQRQASGRCI